MLVPLIFTEFAPDEDPLTPGACQDMNGVFPVEKGMRTLPGLTRVSSGLPSTCFGAYTAYLLGTSITVLATVNGLYVLDANGVAQPQVTGLANTSNRWRFAVYGQDLIAVNGVDPDQFYRLAVGNFSPLPGNPPIASLVATTDYAVILVPPNSQLLFSNLSDTAPWAPNFAVQVYEYNLANIPGNITSVQRKRSLLAVYRQNAIQSATFVGGSIGWDFGSPGTISLTVGAAGNECVINTGDYDYIVGPDDFWQFDGYNLQRVPNHVKEFFFRDLNQGFRQNIAGRYDVLRDLVIWHYPSRNTTRGAAGLLDSYIGFYQRPNPPRWFFGRLDVELPLETPAPDPLHVTTTPDSGVVRLDHSLFLYDDLNAYGPTSDVFVTSNDFGDRQHIWATRRIRPGFTQFPFVQGPNGVNPKLADPAAKCTPLNQDGLTGVPPIPGPPENLSFDGWFNLMNTSGLQRFRIDLFGTAELGPGNVDMNNVGEVWLGLNGPLVPPSPAPPPSNTPAFVTDDLSVINFSFSPPTQPTAPVMFTNDLKTYVPQTALTPLFAAVGIPTNDFAGDLFYDGTTIILTHYGFSVTVGPAAIAVWTAPKGWSVPVVSTGAFLGAGDATGVQPVTGPFAIAGNGSTYVVGGLDPTDSNAVVWVGTGDISQTANWSMKTLLVSASDAIGIVAWIPRLSLFLAFGDDIWTASSSGAVWTPQTARADFFSQFYDDGTTLWALGNTGFWTSTDGSTWTHHAYPASFPSAHLGILFLYFDVTLALWICVVPGTGILWATTPTGTWTQATTSATDQWQNIIRVGTNLFVAGIRTASVPHIPILGSSADGKVWNVTAPTMPAGTVPSGFSTSSFRVIGAPDGIGLGFGIISANTVSPGGAVRNSLFSADEGNTFTVQYDNGYWQRVSEKPV